MRQGDCYISDLFLFFKKVFYAISTSVFIHSGRARLGPAIKANCITFQTVDPEVCTILISSLIGLGPAPLTHFVYDFLKIHFSHYIISTDQILCAL